MPEENGSDSPSRNPDSQALRQDPRTNLPEQSIVGDKPANRSDQQEENSESPSGQVHWINYGTFYLSVILAILTLGTIVVYYLQLQQMIVATKATQGAAYDACMSAKIARQTLLAYQTGVADSHSIAMGTVAQASAAIRGESGTLVLGTVHLNSGLQQAGIDQSKIKNKLDLAFTYTNMGKSAVHNVRIKVTVQLLPHGIEPQYSSKNLFKDSFDIGVMPSGEGTFADPNFIDKDNKFVIPDDGQAEDFRIGKLYVASFGRADYVDVFGVPHWQTFCGFFDNYPADRTHPEIRHKACAQFNRQDSNLLYSIPSNIATTSTTPTVEDIVCTPPKN